ncbi:CBL-interacting protein kinase 2 [Camellia lanceoleosa]|uniref:CBL-interacting protein kinase 2 n=1 Tax=Camellia lanceoleosa TaxID=1840588 RepID=A0ACC0H3V3_9ERIC|nr:CBL-interacting protein kinase 2 [Camellia lanceoleosa]
MGLNGDNSFSEDYEIVCLFGLPVFLLDELGYAIRTTFKLCAQMHNEASSYKLPVVLKHEIGEDGQGNFAKVYYGRNLKSGQSVTIKVIDKERVLKVGLIDQTKRQISIMGFVKFPNVMQLYEVMATVRGALSQSGQGMLKEDIARKYFQQLICAVDFCHGRGVYHRDLKPENLLLDENGTLKVTDFDLSALAESKRQDGLLHTTCGTPSYVAPEVICRKGYDGVKADIWPCGVILFVLLAGYLPFHDSNLMEIYQKISKANYKCPNCFHQTWADFWLNTKSKSIELESKEIAPLNADAIFSPFGNGSAGSEEKIELPKPINLTAFDIISLSTWFDLSGLFVENDQKEEVQFTSAKPASAIISRLEEIARHLKLKVTKKDQGFFKLEESNV